MSLDVQRCVRLSSYELSQDVTQVVLRCVDIAGDGSRCRNIFVDVQKMLDMSKDVLRCLKMSLDCPRCITMSQYVERCLMSFPEIAQVCFEMFAEV